MSDKTSTNNKICINVGGVRFVTREDTFNTLPDTKLYAIYENFGDYYDQTNMEYFFDCDPCVFASVLGMYRNGGLHIPQGLCGVHIKEELSFWGISETKISPCCWKSYYKSFNDLEIHSFLKEEIAFTQKKVQSAETVNTHRCKIFIDKIRESVWLFLMNPRSSKCSKVWHVIYMAIVLFSLSIFCFDHVEYFQEEMVKKLNFSVTNIGKDTQNDIVESININRTHNITTISELDGTLNNSNQMTSSEMVSNRSNGIKKHSKENSSVNGNISMNDSETRGRIFVRHTVWKELILPFFALDRLFNFIFSIEFILRFLACPKKKKFITFLNFAEFVSLIGFSIIFHLGKKWNLLLLECGEYCDLIKLQNDNMALFSILVAGHVLLVFRNFRFFIIGRMNRGFNILLVAVRRSKRELLIFTLTILFNAFIFAGFIFYAEDNESIPDFFDACYWAVVTMTTVGYGDIRPKYPMGKFVAALCSISGLFLLTMPVSVISGNFNQLYRHYGYIEHQNKVKKRKKSKNLSTCKLTNCYKCCF